MKVSLFSVLSLCLTLGAQAQEKSDYELDVEGMIAIRFHNSLRDLYRAPSSLADAVNEAMVRTDATLARGDSPFMGRSAWAVVQAHQYGQAVGEVVVRVPNFFNKADITLFRKGGDAIKANITEVVAIVNRLREYYAKDANKADNNQVYLDAKLRLTTLLSELKENVSALDARSTALATEGEQRLLPKHRMGIYILNMRDVIERAQKLAAELDQPILIRDEYARGKVVETETEQAARIALATKTADSLDAMLNDLRALVERQKTFGADGIENDDMQRVYADRFYKYDVDQRLLGDSGMPAIVTRLRAQGYISSGDAERAAGVPSQLVSTHNEFVDMYNAIGNGDAIQR